MAASEPEPTRLKLGILITLLAYFFFSLASSLVWQLNSRLPTIEIIFVQFATSLLCVAPMALRKGFRALRTKVFPLHFLRDIASVGSFFLYFLAIRYLGLVDATTLNYSAPFFIPFIWRLWRHEKIPTRVWWTIVVGFIGVAIILKPSREIFQLGFVFGVFAGITSAIALAAIRVLNLQGEPMSRTTFYCFLIGALLSLPFAIPIWVSPSITEWFYLIAIGASTAIAQVLLTIAYRYGTASYLSPLGYSAVIFNALIAWLAFDQLLSIRSFIGTLLIIFGGTLTYFFKRKAKTVLQVLQHPQKEKSPPP